jgi:hypothetical protein
VRLLAVNRGDGQLQVGEAKAVVGGEIVILLDDDFADLVNADVGHGLDSLFLRTYALYASWALWAASSLVYADTMTVNR